MKYSDEFLAAVEDHAKAVELLGPEHPATDLAFEKVMALLPPDLQEAMHEKAIEMGLLPPASGYLEDGTAVYRLEDMAISLGVSIEEAREVISRFDDERAMAGLSSGLINPERVYFKQ